MGDKINRSCKTKSIPDEGENKELADEDEDDDNVEDVEWINNDSSSDSDTECVSYFVSK